MFLIIFAFKLYFMELMDVNLENKTFMQHNAITSGRYDYSATMMDILFMVLSSLEVGKLEYTIHTADIELITGRKWNYVQLRQATENIGSRMFEIQMPDKLRQIWLFSYVDYMNGTGSFKIKINDDAKPYFFELKNNFTAMQLKSVLNCTSKYAKRLYALACQWKSVGKKRFEIVELKKMIGLIDKKGNEKSERISEFRIKILDVAKKQINEGSDIYFDYKLIKQGRSFRWVEIYVNTKLGQQLEINFEETIDNQKYLSKIIHYGLSEVQAQLIAGREKEKDFDTLIDDLNLKVRSGKLKFDNSVGYLVGVYQNKGILPKKQI